MGKGHLLPGKSKWNKEGAKAYMPNHYRSQIKCLGTITGRLLCEQTGMGG